MKVSISFFLSAVLITFSSILIVSFYGANEGYFVYQKQHQSVVDALYNSDFSEDVINELRRQHKNVQIKKENKYIYRVDSRYQYRIPMIFFQDERELHNVLYKGGW